MRLGLQCIAARRLAGGFEFPRQIILGLEFLDELARHLDLLAGRCDIECSEHHVAHERDPHIEYLVSDLVGLRRLRFDRASQPAEDIEVIGERGSNREFVGRGLEFFDRLEQETAVHPCPHRLCIELDLR